MEQEFSKFRESKNHWSMNWVNFKSCLSHVSCCHCGSIMVSKARGGRFEPFYCNDKYFCHWIQRIQWKYLGKTQLWRWSAGIDYIDSRQWGQHLLCGQQMNHTTTKSNAAAKWQQKSCSSRNLFTFAVQCVPGGSLTTSLMSMKPCYRLESNGNCEKVR